MAFSAVEFSTVVFGLVDKKSEQMTHTIGWLGSKVIYAEDIKEVNGVKTAKACETTIIGSKVILVFDSISDRWKTAFPTTRKISAYELGPLRLSVYGEPWPSYYWQLNHEPGPINDVCETLAATMIRVSNMNNIFGQLYADLVDKAESALKEKGVEHWLDKLSEICAISVLGLTPLTAAILDREVEEIYLDRPGSLCYLDHSKFGRLWYPYIVGKTTLKRLGLYTQLSTSSSLNYSSNSVKGHLITKSFHLRVSLDTEPLSVDGGNCVIRKFNFERFTLKELVANGTITSECGALLAGLLNKGYNILVSGLPRSGKTTLCNALLKYVPKEWRKVFIEDVIETSPPKTEDKTVRYSTEASFKTDKLLEVTRSLHRSPDFVFVGELQTRQQTLAATMLMDIGIPCIQTVHATTLKGLLSRWKKIYSLEPEFNTPLVVVFMTFEQGKRKVDKVLYVEGNKGRASEYVLFEKGLVRYSNLKLKGLENAFETGLKIVQAGD
jgi:type IV secretory pathway ATPase VirB11/archaellum biosynthesis ATPase